MEEQEMITIRVYDAVNNVYYDKQVPYSYDLEGGKTAKKKELENYIYNLKEIGVEYNGLMFKCDDLASSRINKIITGTSVGANPFPLTWITRNSEQGVVVFNNREDFIAFYTAFSMKELDIQVQEARLKMQIDLATTKEELDAIVFEIPVEETDPITEEVVEEVPAE